MKKPRTRFDRRRLSYDRGVARFLAAHATIAVFVLVLIALFLFKEGAGFFSQNLHNLRLYRLAGLEYVDLMRGQVEGHTALNRSLQGIRAQELQRQLSQGAELGEANAQLAPFDGFSREFSRAIAPMRKVSMELAEVASAIKQKALQGEEEVDFAQEARPLRQGLPHYQQASIALRQEVYRLLDTMPSLRLPSAEGQERLKAFEQATRTYLATFPDAERRLELWEQFEPVPWYRSISAFLFGKSWITNSFWQDVYGVLPLVTGSLIIASLAMLLAVPLGVGAAVYVAEIATPTEQRLVKPFIEFISAIPSVVLGFFGIVVLGNAIRAITHWPILSWVSGFPISERLNAFTASALLALMAIPTIFSLAEDALRSVPRHFHEASYALGATRLQTIARVLLPSALSGIFSAILLGFGRVIGETMVVLLCAGNRIAIPDFTKGVSAFFDPVHTMTGIIAQEMGEVVHGSIQYRALFVVGLLLFALALIINWVAQAAVRRFRNNIQ